jgi:hypothetical protein
MTSVVAMLAIVVYLAVEKDVTQADIAERA